MLDLYFHATPNSMKALVLLNELDLPYSVKPVDIFKGEQHAEAFLAVNPNGKVPALVDEGVAVFDSHAILLHLAHKHGRFLPEDPAGRAGALSWLQMVGTGLSPFSGQAVHFLHYAPEPVPYATTRYTREVERHYRVLDRHLSQAPWLAGDDYSIADMALWGWAASAGYILGERGLGDYPGVVRFMAAMAERPAVRRALDEKARHSFKAELDEASRTALFAAGRTPLAS